MYVDHPKYQSYFRSVTIHWTICEQKSWDCSNNINDCDFSAS